MDKTNSVENYIYSEKKNILVFLFCKNAFENNIRMVLFVVELLLRLSSNTVAAIIFSRVKPRLHVLTYITFVGSAMLERVAGMQDDVWPTLFCWKKCLIDIKTFFQQKMLVKHQLTCRRHVLTLLNQRTLYNDVKTCSRGFIISYHQ